MSSLNVHMLQRRAEKAEDVIRKARTSLGLALGKEFTSLEEAIAAVWGRLNPIDWDTFSG